MSQILEKQLWVLVSSLKEDTKQVDLDVIASSVIGLIDEWQTKGNFIWTGPLDDNKTGMAVFEATQEDARDFYDKYDKACSGVLSSHLYQWGAIPFLSAL